MTASIGKIRRRLTRDRSGTTEMAGASEITSTPDPTRDWGTWEGWGTSLAWWANVSARSTWSALSADTRAIIGRVNVHGYQQRDGRRDLLYSAVHDAGKALWNSEYGEHDATGITMAGNLSLDMRWLHPTAWVYWQAIDGNNWGLIAGDQDTATLGQVNVKYFVLAQYTRHIRPGMHILPAGDTETVAAFDPQERRLVLVTVNTQQETSRSYDLSRFGSVGSEKVRTWMTTGDGSRLYEKRSDIDLAEKRFAADFPANSVRTFLVEDISP